MTTTPRQRSLGFICALMIVGSTSQSHNVLFVHAQQARQSVPIESLPLVNAHCAAPISPSDQATFGGQAIVSGLRLRGNGCSSASAEMQLTHDFTTLSGRAVIEDRSDPRAAAFLILDMSSPTHAVPLFKSPLLTLGESKSFHVNVRGVRLLEFLYDAQTTSATIDVVDAVVSSGLPPSAHPQEQPRKQPQAPTLQLSFQTALPGSQQTAIVSTRPNAYVTFIVGYPVGKPRVVGPERADIAGHLTYTWGVPGTVHGTVRVFAVTSTGVAQATFTVGP